MHRALRCDRLGPGGDRDGPFARSCEAREGFRVKSGSLVTVPSWLSQRVRACAKQV